MKDAGSVPFGERREETIDVERFFAAELRVGTVRAAFPNPRARPPAYVLEVDFGPHGTRRSSARIVEHYRPDDLVGRQVVAVVNLPPRRVAGETSEVLVLGALDATGVVLLAPERPVPDGTRIA